MKAYRYLTGADDAAFCRKVTDLLNRGWAVLGAPTLAYDPVNETMICGQTLYKEIEGQDYDPSIDLGML